MLQFEELRQTLREKEPDLRELSDDLGLEQTREEIEKLEQQAAAPGFWDVPENTQKVLQRTAALKAKVEKYERLKSQYEDAMTLIEMGDEAGDLDMLDEVKGEIDRFTEDLESLRLTTLLTGEYDANNAILTFHAGAGGTEAQDWASMLYRMYNRWAERHGYNFSCVYYI